MSDYRRTKTYQAERLYLATSRTWPVAAIQRAEFEVCHDIELDCMVAQLQTYFHGMPKEEIVVDERWPKDWWQAFREQWFPKWVLKRWPVQYREIHIRKTLYLAVCPHIQEDPQSEHLVWLANKHDRYARGKIPVADEDRVDPT